MFILFIYYLIIYDLLFGRFRWTEITALMFNGQFSMFNVLALQNY